MGPTQLRVLIVDDSTTIRKNLARIFAESEEIEVGVRRPMPGKALSPPARSIPRWSHWTFGWLEEPGLEIRY